MKIIKSTLNWLSEWAAAICLVILLLTIWRQEVRDNRQDVEVDNLISAINHSTLGAAVAEADEIRAEQERKAPSRKLARKHMEILAKESEYNVKSR